jgi:predicted nucleic acid-binding protein
MTYLLDTVVLSDPFNVRPSLPVADWIKSRAAETSYTSAICLGELRRGFERFAPGVRRTRLEQWLRRVAAGDGYLEVLPVDVDVAVRWGALVSSLERFGQRPPVADSLIAATALTHNLTVVTRNVRDFERCGVAVLNPWTS